MARDSELSELKKRIEALKEERAKRDAPRGGPMRDAGRALNLAFRLLVEIAAGIAFGLFIGYWADRWAGTAPLFLLLFTLLGLAAGIRNIARAETPSARTTRPEAEERQELRGGADDGEGGS